jgi:hypothetical protein
MSETSQGPGWWLASDGKWYPPQSAPQPPPPLPPPLAAPPGYPAQPYPVQDNVRLLEPKKKFYTRVWFWLLIGVAILFGGCTALIVGGTVAVNHMVRQKHTIVYSVTGSGQAGNITYGTLLPGSEPNGQSQLTNVSLPWSKTIVISGPFAMFNVSATVGESGGTVTCTIIDDGQQVATNTASGSFESADCSTEGDT